MTLFLLIVISLSSGTAVVIGARQFRLPTQSVPLAVVTMLECLGLCAVFYAANIVAAAFVVFVTRALGLTFVSAYITTDVVWLIFSLLQAMTFRWWLGLSCVPTKNKERNTGRRWRHF